MEIQLKEIILNESNPRFIRDEAFLKLKRSVAQFPAMLQKRGLAVRKKGKKWETIGGNMRFRALTDLQAEIADPEKFKKTYKVKAKEIQVLESYFTDGIPCIDCSEFTDKEVQRFVIADNVPFGEWDTEVLANEWSADDLAEWGLDIEFAQPEPEAFEDDYQIPDEIETDIVLGDLFEIGPHRLLCGDSTDSEQVSELMNGKKADMVFTDPPYGVSIVGTKNNKSIAGDLSQTVIPFSFEIAVMQATNEKAKVYFCGGESNILMYYKLFDRYLRQMPRHLIWVKEMFVMKPNGYHNQYEIIYHGYKSGGGDLKEWHGGRTEHEASDVWQIKRDVSSSYLHPTQKPVELPSRAIKNSSPVNGLIYEPFTGSGSTMVAAHQLNRVCYGMELDPKYCQIIVDRMLKLDPSLQIKKNGQPYQSLVTHS